MVWLYTSRDMVLCLRKSEVFGCIGKVYLLQVLLTSVSSADYFTNYLCLLECKIFTQPGTYCPTSYCPNDMVK